mmetsp:Transcript_28094/g.62533  ORF Transcript_28094/g.62533 Transcript_28094/m.62533 type:complete len:207 (-) Transcript_28094:2020-2640(-)
MVMVMVPRLHPLPPPRLRPLLLPRLLPQLLPPLPSRRMLLGNWKWPPRVTVMLITSAGSVRATAMTTLTVKMVYFASSGKGMRTFPAAMAAPAGGLTTASPIAFAILSVSFRRTAAATPSNSRPRGPTLSSSTGWVTTLRASSSVCPVPTGRTSAASLNSRMSRLRSWQAPGRPLASPASLLERVPSTFPVPLTSTMPTGRSRRLP